MSDGSSSLFLPQEEDYNDFMAMHDTPGPQPARPASPSQDDQFAAAGEDRVGDFASTLNEFMAMHISTAYQAGSAVSAAATAGGQTEGVDAAQLDGSMNDAAYQSFLDLLAAHANPQHAGPSQLVDPSLEWDDKRLAQEAKGWRKWSALHLEDLDPNVPAEAWYKRLRQAASHLDLPEWPVVVFGPKDRLENLFKKELENTIRQAKASFTWGALLTMTFEILMTKLQVLPKPGTITFVRTLQTHTLIHYNGGEFNGEAPLLVAHVGQPHFSVRKTLYALNIPGRYKLLENEGYRRVSSWNLLVPESLRHYIIPTNQILFNQIGQDTIDNLCVLEGLTEGVINRVLVYALEGKADELFADVVEPEKHHDDSFQTLVPGHILSTEEGAALDLLSFLQARSVVAPTEEPSNTPAPDTAGTGATDAGAVMACTQGVDEVGKTDAEQEAREAEKKNRKADKKKRKSQRYKQNKKMRKYAEEEAKKAQIDQEDPHECEDLPAAGPSIAPAQTGTLHQSQQEYTVIHEPMTQGATVESKEEGHPIETDNEGSKASSAGEDDHAVEVTSHQTWSHDSGESQVEKFCEVEDEDPTKVSAKPETPMKTAEEKGGPEQRVDFPGGCEPVSYEGIPSSKPSGKETFRAARWRPRRSRPRSQTLPDNWRVPECWIYPFHTLKTMPIQPVRGAREQKPLPPAGPAYVTQQAQNITSALPMGLLLPRPQPNVGQLPPINALLDCGPIPSPPVPFFTPANTVFRIAPAANQPLSPANGLFHVLPAFDRSLQFFPADALYHIAADAPRRPFYNELSWHAAGPPLGQQYHPVLLPRWQYCPGPYFDPAIVHWQ
ncbi:hypothetical protein M406DRAFT_68143 [Cryphonectria parasitica EP155]|uniref:Uncharacterized protein n=1 Tax=Cryphonectria parasitica (strain ATCC 38755 / EP155) TaxID=660469 RepID=A0A9P5CQ72_CRYP1|nr:uncharacterized protein M406DRAFT_68143 [Cryphonectria parasitica EP155]KAF3765725.1 hypothetical protein M406DRAFT_68143 [Cryphonectria parasitica EP155]